ncbi:restriction endonuclease [Priestia aryabhattai]|uniref:restriction endonuclease n=1 Tax=Priestia aryabhattai TaxID=412384 RepID=UPI00234E94E5|nr:restriction endonuclease [Priestia aryabhattai]MDC7767287.1 restriction endonuclease [Priestia aryabhattai]
MLVEKEPSTWKELQNCVGQVFRDIGFEVLVDEKDFQLRGGDTVNLDVWAKDIELPTMPTIHICECKYWKETVPKEKVHAFRTVVSDAGGSVGYIISQKGFQEGAEQAASQTNINLITWDDFQQIFEEKWVKSMYSQVKDKIDSILNYINSRYLSNDFKGEGEKYLKSIRILGRLLSLQSTFIYDLIKESKYPLKIVEPDGTTQEFTNRKKYFTELLKIVESIKQQFEGIVGRKID